MLGMFVFHFNGNIIQHDKIRCNSLIRYEKEDGLIVWVD